MNNIDLLDYISIESMYLVIGFIIGFTFAIKYMVIELIDQEENDNETFEEKERKKGY